MEPFRGQQVLEAREKWGRGGENECKALDGKVKSPWGMRGIKSSIVSQPRTDSQPIWYELPSTSQRGGSRVEVLTLFKAA